MLRVVAASQKGIRPARPPLPISVVISSCPSRRNPSAIVHSHHSSPFSHHPVKSPLSYSSSRSSLWTRARRNTVLRKEERVTPRDRRERARERERERLAQLVAEILSPSSLYEESPFQCNSISSIVQDVIPKDFVVPERYIVYFVL